MGKIKGVRDGTGPYGPGKKRRASGICPFDEESKEDLIKMKLKVDIKKDVKIVDSKIGKRGFLE